jgi:hypothetical protein
LELGVFSVNGLEGIVREKHFLRRIERSAIRFAGVSGDQRSKGEALEGYAKAAVSGRKAVEEENGG